ncbi:MAG: LacI family transcriptional regulator [Rariglobus sp.]|jgi:LacI family transcriptional regulator/LacI family fructose operon transcriptional repressor|nr:LacI family transcriptional regulator [Rariglobus sp.]
MPLMHPQTLQNIADQAGVSRMSASRALSGRPGVSEDTRAKILKIAATVGYRPNPLVSTLMASLRAKRVRPSTETGTVLAFIARADRAADARTEHLKGAAQAAEMQGYRVESFITGDAGLPPARLSRILLARNICGVVIAPLPEGHGWFELDWPRFYTVAIEYTFVAPRFDLVVHDHYASMRMVLNKCREKGLRRIGLLLSQNGSERTEGLYTAAYWMEQKSADGFPAIPPLCLTSDRDSGRIARWFERYRPEVVITSGLLFRHMESFVRERGLRIPDDVSILNVNTASAKYSGVNQNNHMIGATAVQLLVDKIRRNDRGIPEHATTVLLPGTWVEGSTFRSSVPGR